MELIEGEKHRKDIDGLRAIAVLPVIVFHFGFLPRGYLGVDIFFVISGFLITGIIYREVSESRFSIVNFYMRRIRRILPLTGFICLTAIAVGMAVMLPDDLENMAQSVIATNLFSNNILEAIKTSNYWDVVNEYKPLMHTWSLAIEEQYYLFYPFIFILLTKKRLRFALPIVLGLALLSMVLFALQDAEFKRFYYLPYRFFELAFGGAIAIALNGRVVQHRFTALPLVMLVALMIVPMPFLPESFALILSVALTCMILASANGTSKIAAWALQNPAFVFIGKISFSLYMWHQLVMAYARYAVFPEIDLAAMALLTVLIFFLSVLTYYFVEQPFRNKKRMKAWVVLAAVGSCTLVTTSLSVYIYLNAGVIRDVPELGITTDKIERQMHSKYNSDIYSYDREFKDDGRLKVLVVGDSFGRDWMNVLLESSYAEELDLSYLFAHRLMNEDAKAPKDLAERAKQADVIFLSRVYREAVEDWPVAWDKVWVIGTKSFGVNSGIFYNYRGEDYFTQRTEMERGIDKINGRIRKDFPDRMIDLIALVIDDDETVPVFTPDKKFISQDTRHFTKFGAIYFADMLDDRLGKIFKLPVHGEPSSNPN